MSRSVRWPLKWGYRFTKAPKLPIGLQLLGKPFGEEAMLKIAHAYEQSTGWHKERAAIGV